jgi:hypothetical protein
VEEVLGTDGAARDQQSGLPADNRIRVDDAKVHPCDPIGIQVVLLDGHRGGDRQPQPTGLGQQGDGSDLVGRIGQRPSQPYPQRRAAFGHGQPHAPGSVKPKGAVVEPDRHERALAAREPRHLPVGDAAPPPIGLVAGDT